MIVLAYLISPPLFDAKKVGAHNTPNRILFGVRKTDKSDADHLSEASEILLGMEKRSTYDALYKHLPFNWNVDEKYDMVNPFGDLRQYQYQALWTFDTRNDVLCYTSASHCSKIPLGLLRERTVSLADMELLGGPIPVPLKHTFDSDTPFWKPHVEVSKRMRAFTHRLLRDFHCQWRHILRNNYNFLTLRILSRAIIRLSTLDFEIHEDTGGHGPRGVHVWITDLPAWKPFEANIVRVGSVWVVLCQDIQNGLSIAQEHIVSPEVGRTESLSTTKSGEAHVRYMILSVKHIMLCHATDRATLKHTAPEPLFNGDYDTEPPSDLALDYLVWATASARPLIFTTISSLPVEVQDTILNYSSVGTVLAAKLGCMLDLGSPFLWKDGSLKVTLEERYVIRPSNSSVESQIWFGEHKSGIFYLARPWIQKSTTMAQYQNRTDQKFEIGTPTPRTYLDKLNVQINLQLVEQSPESHDYSYKRLMIAILRHFFLEKDNFGVFQEELRGESYHDESSADVAVLKITCRPGGSLYTYEYCFVESKKAHTSWIETEHHLSRHCAGTENPSGLIYGIVHIGFEVQFFAADRGVLTALSSRLHILNDVNAITTMFGNMNSQPFPFL